MNSTLKSLLFWVVLVVVGVLIYDVSTSFEQRDHSITFSEFVGAANSGTIGRVTITGQEITGVTKANETFHTYAPTNYEGLVKGLIALGVVVDVKEEAAMPWASLLYSWAPAVLVIGFLIFFMLSFESRRARERARERDEQLERFNRLEGLLSRIAVTLGSLHELRPENK